MKILKRIVASLVALGFVFGIGFVSVSAEEVTASGEDPNFAKVKKQDDELDPIIKEVYSKHIKEIGDVKKAALDEQGVDSVEKLAKITKQNIKDSEKQIKDKMHKEIDKVMKKYGWEQVEDTYSDDQQMTTNSTSGNISLTRSLYKSSDGYYTYYGYWDWTDGKWDSYHDIEDILAVRSTKDMTQRVSAYIYSWDNYGYSRHDRVARRSWEADGATFNVHDYLGYGWGGSMPMYNTDNGYAKFTFKAPTGTEIYTHFEHNYEAYSWYSNAVIDVVNLSNSSFSVSYSKKNSRWATVGNPYYISN